MSTSGGVSSIATPPYALPSGSWVSPVLGVAGANTSIGAGAFRGTPFWLPYGCTVSKLGAIVNTAGSTDATATLTLHGSPTASRAWTLVAATSPLVTTSTGAIAGVLSSPITVGPGWMMLGVVMAPTLTTAPAWYAMASNAGASGVFSMFATLGGQGVNQLAAGGFAFVSSMSTPPPVNPTIAYSAQAAPFMALGL